MQVFRVAAKLSYLKIDVDNFVKRLLAHLYKKIISRDAMTVDRYTRISFVVFLYIRHELRHLIQGCHIQLEMRMPSIATAQITQALRRLRCDRSLNISRNHRSSFLCKPLTYCSTYTTTST